MWGTSEKVGYSIGSAWVKAGAAFDERGHGKVWGSKGAWMGTRSVFLWRPGFPVLSRRIIRRVFSLIWIILGKRLAVVGENCLQEGEGSGLFIESKCLMIQHDFHPGGGGERFQKQQLGQEWRRDSQRLLCKHI